MLSKDVFLVLFVSFLLLSPAGASAGKRASKGVNRRASKGVKKLSRRSEVQRARELAESVGNAVADVMPPPAPTHTQRSRARGPSRHAAPSASVANRAPQRGKKRRTPKEGEGAGSGAQAIGLPARLPKRPRTSAKVHLNREATRVGSGYQKIAKGSPVDLKQVKKKHGRLHDHVVNPDQEFSVSDALATALPANVMGLLCDIMNENRCARDDQRRDEYLKEKEKESQEKIVDEAGAEEDSGTEEDAGADAVGNDDEAANVPFKKRGVATPRGVSEKRKKTKKKRGENMPKTVRVSRRLQDLRPVLEGSPDDWDNLAPTDPVEGWAARSCFSEPISVDELKEFCAVLWRCSMDRPHELEAIWAGDRNVKYDFSTMPRNRFLEILRCFLFSHAQVLQVIELINLVMADVWAASNVVVVDETMCAFKGRKDNPHHVFICRKPKPNGIKMWTTCDASGVVLKTSLFERVNVNGKKTEKELTKDTLLKMAKACPAGGYVIADGLFGSAAAAEALAELGYDFTFSCRSDRPTALIEGNRDGLNEGEIASAVFFVRGPPTEEEVEAENAALLALNPLEPPVLEPSLVSSSEGDAPVAAFRSPLSAISEGAGAGLGDDEGGQGSATRAGTSRHAAAAEREAAATLADDTRARFELGKAALDKLCGDKALPKNADDVLLAAAQEATRKTKPVLITTTKHGKKMVHTMTSVSSNRPTDSTLQERLRVDETSDDKGQEVRTFEMESRPECRDDYSKLMDCVDECDRVISGALPGFKWMHWSAVVVFQLLTMMGINNAKQYYRSGSGAVDTMQVKEWKHVVYKAWAPTCELYKVKGVKRECKICKINGLRSQSVWRCKRCDVICMHCALICKVGCKTCRNPRRVDYHRLYAQGCLRPSGRQNTRFEGKLRDQKIREVRAMGASTMELSIDSDTGGGMVGDTDAQLAAQLQDEEVELAREAGEVETGRALLAASLADAVTTSKEGGNDGVAEQETPARASNRDIRERGCRPSAGKFEKES